MTSLWLQKIAAWKGHKAVAKKRYCLAITIAARNGLVNEQALANERMGDYIQECGDVNEAEYRWNHAIDLCTEWGALAKVEQVRRNIDTLARS